MRRSDLPLAAAASASPRSAARSLNCYGFAWDFQSTAEVVNFNRNFIRVLQAGSAEFGLRRIVKYLATRLFDLNAANERPDTQRGTDSCTPMLNSVATPAVAPAMNSAHARIAVLRSCAGVPG